MLPETIESYRQAYHKRAEAERKRCAELQQHARRDAEIIAAFLCQEYHAEKVVLIGSLVSGKDFRLNSDIDLVVYGLPKQLYFSACASLRSFTEFDVDVIPYESAYDSIKRRVESEGVILAQR
jgi:predicted nucleotidyltransferase